MRCQALFQWYLRCYLTDWLIGQWSYTLFGLCLWGSSVALSAYAYVARYMHSRLSPWSIPPSPRDPALLVSVSPSSENKVLAPPFPISFRRETPLCAIYWTKSAAESPESPCTCGSRGPLESVLVRAEAGIALADCARWRDTPAGPGCCTRKGQPYRHPHPRLCPWDPSKQRHGKGRCSIPLHSGGAGSTWRRWHREAAAGPRARLRTCKSSPGAALYTPEQEPEPEARWNEKLDLGRVSFGVGWRRQDHLWRTEQKALVVIRKSGTNSEDFVWNLNPIQS